MQSNKRKTLSFLLVGQSNMTGRAGWYADSPIPSPSRQWHYRKGDAIENKLAGFDQVDPNIFRLNANKRLEIAEEPLHFDVDDKKCGIGPGLAFANALRLKSGFEETRINLIPCAAGHTSLSNDWNPGKQVFERMLERANAVKHVDAVLFSQGETEAMKEDTAAETHANQLREFISATRKELSNPSLPFYLIQIPDGLISSREVQNAIKSVADEDKFTNLVDTADLEFGQDNIHWNTKSMITLGKRIAEMFTSVVDPKKEKEKEKEQKKAKTSSKNDPDLSAVRSFFTADGISDDDKGAHVQNVSKDEKIIKTLGKPTFLDCCPTGTVEFMPQSKNAPLCEKDYPEQAVCDTVQALKDRLSTHPPKFLILYGSLREKSLSRMLAIESGRILASYGAYVKIFNPKDLPLFSEDVDPDSIPAVREFRSLVQWCEGFVWSTPEIHGNFSAVIKNQVDWMPIKTQAVRPTQGKTLAVMEVSGGSQTFNAVNNLRVLGRWMRCLVIPNQSSIPLAEKAFVESDVPGVKVLAPGSYRNRVTDVLEELYKYTLLVRDQQPYLTARFSEKTK